MQFCLPNQRVEKRMSIRVPVIEESQPVNDCPVQDHHGRQGFIEGSILTDKTERSARSAGKL